MDKIIIWGGTGQAIVLEELLSYYDIAPSVIFENNTAILSPFKGVPVFYKEKGFKEWFDREPDAKEYYFLVAIGGNNGNTRQAIGNMLEAHGLRPYAAIHPQAFVARNAAIGKAVQVLANSSVCARAVIGDYCIINTGASIDHECLIGNGVHIGPGAKLAGAVVAEDNVFIGINATVLPKIKIGANSIVGGGAVVIRDVPANCTVAGNPARIIKRSN